VGNKEARSVKILTDYLEAHDFAVELGVAGLATAFVARYKNGTPGPNLGSSSSTTRCAARARDFHGDQHSAQDLSGWPPRSPSRNSSRDPRRRAR